MSYGGAYQQHSFPGNPQQGQQPQAYGQQPQQAYGQQPQAYQFSQQRMEQYQQQWQPSQHYGQYGNYYQQSVFSVQAHQAFQLNSVDELRHVFMTEMAKNPENKQRNSLQAEDLMNVLNNTQCIRNYFRVNWSRELCSIMIMMLDRNKDGFLQWEEFLELQQCLVAWFNVFCQHDANRSGFMESHELVRVIRDLFGYQISPQALETILKRYSRCVPPNRLLLAFDDFVSVSVRLRAYTDAFRQRDRACNGAETGNTMFGYDDMCDVSVRQPVYEAVQTFYKYTTAKG